MMGRIEDNKKKRKEKDSNPLNEIGNRDRNTDDVDLDKKTIKDKQKKK